MGKFRNQMNTIVQLRYQQKSTIASRNVKQVHQFTNPEKGEFTVYSASKSTIIKSHKVSSGVRSLFDDTLHGRFSIKIAEGSRIRTQFMKNKVKICSVSI